MWIKYSDFGCDKQVCGWSMADDRFHVRWHMGHDPATITARDGISSSDEPVVQAWWEVHTLELHRMGEATDCWASVSLLRKDLKIKSISEVMSTHLNCKTYLTVYMVEWGASLANLSSIFLGSCWFCFENMRRKMNRRGMARDGHR